jgi:hypothetical protein
MPSMNDLFPSNYLKPADLEEDAVLTIKSIKQEKIGQGRDADDKWIVYFKEERKGLVLNKTNANVLAKLYGDDTDDWVGKQVILFATEVQFKDEMVEAIRIRSKPPKAKAKAAPAAPAAPAAAVEDGEDDDLPF